LICKVSRVRIYGAALLCHFLLIFAVSWRETLWAIGRGLTFAPHSLEGFAKSGEDAISTVLGQSGQASNLHRVGLVTYLHLAGIESGYGFFAPNISGNYKLVIELHFSDGRVEYDVPAVGSDATGLRLAGFLDKMGRPQYEPLREALTKLLAYSVWRVHPDATRVRAVFGSVKLPSPSEFERGVRERDEFLYAYDFTPSN
jgi:hypothetical protein